LVHELSIALSIIEGAEEEVARQGGGRVCAIHLKLGPLSGVVSHALLFSYTIACQGTPLEGSELMIEEVPIRLYCNRCQSEEDPISTQRLHCRRCEGADCHVISGDQLELATMELQT
jgi:hydrogenase nickel incorporation protein HypA/HybF